MRCQILKRWSFLQRDHDQLKKVITSLTEIGVKISKTKSRLELIKVLEDVKPVQKYSELHS
ncbi:Lmo0850 family protein [Lederbergia lenta]|uniref:Lmo0850 family protein n=1 Tax=Lederbergia lenta TaxID=1467 RepID=UPI002DB66BD2|nr:Lmo0850 family protein [Lederbergia lenta]